ncbi:MAG: hypothetical protein IJW96_02195 [Clostridia bacterium]|nr:hypothetical protein [Clostridia bacterium]
MGDKNIIIKKYKKQLNIFRIIAIISILVVFIYFLITILRCETFDQNALVSCLVFASTIVVFCLLFTFFDVKRNSIILKYYGKVGDVDKNKAKELLKKMNIVDKNEYDFFDILRCDLEDLPIQQILKKLSKGKKIYVGLFEPIKAIEQEIKSNKEKYPDEDFNHFIFDIVLLIENNVCDI